MGVSDVFIYLYSFQRYFPFSLIKYNVDKEEPLRDSAGFCIEADRGALKTGLWEPFRNIEGPPSRGGYADLK